MPEIETDVDFEGMSDERETMAEQLEVEHNEAIKRESGISRLQKNVFNSLRDKNYFIEFRGAEVGKKSTETAQAEVCAEIPESVQESKRLMDVIKRSYDALVTGEEVFEIDGNLVCGEAQHMDDLRGILDHERKAEIALTDMYLDMKEQLEE